MEIAGYNWFQKIKLTSLLQHENCPLNPWGKQFPPRKPRTKVHLSLRPTSRSSLHGTCVTDLFTGITHAVASHTGIENNYTSILPNRR